MVGGSLIARVGRESGVLSPAFSRNKRLVVGLMVAGVIALLLTFCLHSVAHAQGTNAHRPILANQPDGTTQTNAACAALEDCLVNISAPTLIDNQAAIQHEFSGSGQTKPHLLGIQNPLNGSVLFFFTPADMTVSNPQVRALHNIVLGIVDAFIVIIMMLNGIRTILGGSVFRYTNVVESLPGVLLALVAAHISLLIVALFLGLNNAASVDLYNWSKTHSNSASLGQLLESQQCKNALDGRVIAHCTLLLRQEDSLVPDNFNLPNISDVLTSLRNVTQLIVKVLGLMLLAQVIIRLFFINLYLVLGPVGIACWALPGKAGQPLTRMWLQGFISTIMVQLVQIIAVIVVQYMLNVIAVQLTSIASLQPGPLDGTTSPLGDMLRISALWFILRIPALLGSSPLRIVSEAGQAMGQAAGASLAVGVAELQGAISVGTSVASIGIAR